MLVYITNINDGITKSIELFIYYKKSKLLSDGKETLDGH